MRVIRIVAVEETLHDDFVYFDDYEMRTREEWLEGLQDFWKTEAVCSVMTLLTMNQREVFKRVTI
jgi:hypothetical protein